MDRASARFFLLIFIDSLRILGSKHMMNSIFKKISQRSVRMSHQFDLIQNSVNPYRDNVQGKANEPITVAGLLDRSKRILGSDYEGPKPDWELGEIYQRLEVNAPRIAIIGGSSDHPAHIMDDLTTSRAALRIWQNGGVPFYFSTPVLCDGTAQSNQGMSYSLQSRNAVAQMVVNQMEAHSYHGAFVIQGCDKQPLGVVSALVHLDRLRKYRGEAPLFATFAPAHVLQGGTIPEDLVLELQQLSQFAKQNNHGDLAEDLEDAMSYILQCSSNTAFEGVFERAQERGLINKEQHKDFEKRLAVATCDGQGGVCAFNGTGNSSRHLVAGMGLVHPALELLTDPPLQHQVNEAVDALGHLINKSEFGAANILGANIRNAIRIHSASGGSTNLMMHIIAAMLYGGYRFDLWELDRIHHEVPVPDLMNYSLTEGRDIFVLAMQCCDGESRGMESMFYELLQNGVPMDVNAPTVTGQSWRSRLAEGEGIEADRVTENQIILSTPRRPYSGVDVLGGNFFESAVVKISGMSSKQLDQFDKKMAFVLYYENEDEANKQLLQSDLFDRLHKERVFSHEHLLSMLRHNADNNQTELADSATTSEQEDYDSLYTFMLEQNILKLAIVVSGQGPLAFGMPEMFTPMQHINASRYLKRVATLISDGRYSGVTYGAAVGHMTPEAMNDGGILYLQTGDMLHLDFRGNTIHFLDPQVLKQPLLESTLSEVNFDQIRSERVELAQARLKALQHRQRQVAGSNRMHEHTDASVGVVPAHIVYEAVIDYKQATHLSQSSHSSRQEKDVR